MRSLVLLGCVMSLASSWVFAEGDPVKGEEVYEACAVCHGEHGGGSEDFGAPRLAGQHNWYLITQLENFREGIRGTHDDDDNGQVMQPMAEALEDQDIEDVVAYIGTLSGQRE